MQTDYEIVFPDWANKALFNDEKMAELWQYIERQVKKHEPRYQHRHPDGTHEPISMDENRELYERVVSDRVEGIIRAFFHPFKFDGIKNGLKVALGRCSKISQY